MLARYFYYDRKSLTTASAPRGSSGYNRVVLLVEDTVVVASTDTTRCAVHSWPRVDVFSQPNVPNKLARYERSQASAIPSNL